MKPTPLEKVTNRLESQIGEAFLAFKNGDEITAASKMADAIIAAIKQIGLSPELILPDRDLD